MQRYDKEIYYASMFRGELIRHLYQHYQMQDQYIHFLLIGHDETSNKGMMLTNAALLEHLRLLQKIENGKYLLGDNAKKWIIYLYRDALLVNLHSLCMIRFLRQITQLGHQEYVEIFLSAQECIFIQKSHFHQLMNQLNSLSAKSVLAGEKLVATYSIST